MWFNVVKGEYYLMLRVKRKLDAHNRLHVPPSFLREADYKAQQYVFITLCDDGCILIEKEEKDGDKE